MRSSVSGIGKTIEKLMKSKNISYAELSEKTEISVNILKAIVQLKKEPYVFPEMERLFNAFEMKDKEKLKFMEEWIDLVRQKNL